MTAIAEPEGFEDLLLHLGRMNYAWTNTESLLIHLIAGLAGTSKDVALIIYLTLNTTRARVDLVERLVKMTGRAEEERLTVLDATGRLIRLSGLRNRYNHCIFAFDPEGGNPRTILMRISDRKAELKMGRTNEIDEDALAEVAGAIRELKMLNRDIWAIIRDRGYPA